MAYAMLYPEPAKGGRGQKVSVTETVPMVSFSKPASSSVTRAKRRPLVS